MPNKNGTNTVDVDEERPAPDTAQGNEAEAKKAETMPSKPGAKSSGSRRRKLLLIIAASLLVLVGAGYFIHNALLYEDTDDAQVDGHIMPLSAKISGLVQQVNVVEGQVVHAGDVLVIIDLRDYQVASLQSTANLADAEASAAGSHYNVAIASASAFSGRDSAQAAVKNAEAGVAAAEQNLQAYEAVLQQAQANAAKTDADLVRYGQLVEKEDVSRQLMRLRAKQRGTVESSCDEIGGRRGSGRKTSTTAIAGKAAASQSGHAQRSASSTADLAGAFQSGRG